MSDESKAKLSASAKLRLQNPENNGMYGKKHSDKSKKLMSEIQSGEKSWMYGKRGTLCHNFGRKHSDETKLKQSKLRKGQCTIKPMPGKLNPRWLGYYVTPFGTFETSELAEKAIGINRKTVTKRCKSDDYLDWYITKEV